MSLTATLTNNIVWHNSRGSIVNTEIDKNRFDGELVFTSGTGLVDSPAGIVNRIWYNDIQVSPVDTILSLDSLSKDAYGKPFEISFVEGDVKGLIFKNLIDDDVNIELNFEGFQHQSERMAVPPSGCHQITNYGGWPVESLLNIKISSDTETGTVICGILAAKYDFTNEFKVHRGSSSMGSSVSTVSITNGTEYNLESDNSHAFIRITNSRLSGMGDSGTVQPEELGIWVSGDLETSISFNRFNADLLDFDSNTIDWEIIEYIGEDGGPNEWEVRETGIVDTTTTIGTGNLISNIDDINKCCLFLTGQACLSELASDNDAMLGVTDLVMEGSEYRPRIRRGPGPQYRGSFALLELTGSNWRDVQEIEFTAQSGTGNWDTGSPEVFSTIPYNTPLLDFNKSFLHTQYMASGVTNNMSSYGDVVVCSGNTDLVYRRRSATDETLRTIKVWVIENIGAGGDTIRVEHHDVYRSDTTPQTGNPIFLFPINQIDTESTSIMGECCSTNATTTDIPKGFSNFRIVSSTGVQVTEAEEDEEERIGFSVVKWPRKIFIT